MVYHYSFDERIHNGHVIYFCYVFTYSVMKILFQNRIYSKTLFGICKDFHLLQIFQLVSLSSWQKQKKKSQETSHAVFLLMFMLKPPLKGDETVDSRTTGQPHVMFLWPPTITLLSFPPQPACTEVILYSLEEYINIFFLILVFIPELKQFCKEVLIKILLNILLVSNKT